jgi:hypothetical protein
MNAYLARLGRVHERSHVAFALFGIDDGTGKGVAARNALHNVVDRIWTPLPLKVARDSDVVEMAETALGLYVHVIPGDVEGVRMRPTWTRWHDTFGGTEGQGECP